MPAVLKIHPSDNVWIALENVKAGSTPSIEGEKVTAVEDIEIKHKMAITDIAVGEHIYMYGTIVGKATQPIYQGMRITTENTTHDTASVLKSAKNT